MVDQSEALKAYARAAQLSDEIQADIYKLNLIAARRLGEITGGMKRAKPGVKPSELIPSFGINSTKTITLAEAGIDIRRANEYEDLHPGTKRVLLDIKAGKLWRASHCRFPQMQPKRQAFQKAQ